MKNNGQYFFVCMIHEWVSFSCTRQGVQTAEQTSLDLKNALKIFYLLLSLVFFFASCYMCTRTHVPEYKCSTECLSVLLCFCIVVAQWFAGVFFHAKEKAHLLLFFIFSLFPYVSFVA
jgi:protein-S-isoprenylcysteine O-methyltransferase Ste14